MSSRNSIVIVLRTSMNIHNIYAKRPFGLTRKSMVFKCLESLLTSCKRVRDRVMLHIVDDSSPEEIREEMTELLKRYGIKSRLHKVSFKSNSKSLGYSYDIVLKSKEKICFVADDDYLYTPETISEIIEAYDDKIIGTGDFAVFPFDYPERYEKIYPSYIFLGRRRHWRSVGHATGSVFLPTKIFRKEFPHFLDFVKTLDEKQSISHIWKNVPLISPMPSLAAHLNDETMPPFVDWRKMIEEI